VLRHLSRKARVGWTIIRSSRGIRGRIAAVFLVMKLALAYFARRILGLAPPVALPSAEARQPLPKQSGASDGFFRQLVHPVGIYRYEMLKEKFAPTPTDIDPDRPVTVNFLLPTIDRRILFGGYHAAFRFVDALMARGHHVRLIVVEPSVAPREKLLDSFAGDAFMTSVLERCEILLRTDPARPIAFHPDDRLIAYSWDTARIAHGFGQRLGRPFIFFIQEYEAIFHPHDSIFFLIKDTYSLPHFAIFNSRLLQDYFRRHRLGVFGPGEQAGDRNSVAFAHALCAVRTPSVEEMAARQTRRLLAYTRPEAHAGRNLFEIVLMALNQAIEEGVFDAGEWSFHGIGTLALDGSYRLSGGHALEMLPRMDIESYARKLAEYDVGVCLMLAPHPSVPPFEMAAAGLCTVTTGFDNRPAETMRAISRNLIAADHSVASVVAALREAVARAEDFEGRVEGARFGQVTDWADSFNDAFFARLPIGAPAGAAAGRPGAHLPQEA